MKCLECDTRMKVTRETIPYRESGLPHVRLQNVEIRRCPACGYSEEVIPRIERLHETLAHEIAVKSAKLTGEEIRFLRKWLGWDRAEFARHVDVQPETVTRWETNKQVMSGTTERLLRLMALTQQPKQDYSLDMLAEVGRNAAKATRINVRERDHMWELATL